MEIDDISEDELSILKNEIYKTTVMLKKTVENSVEADRGHISVESGKDGTRFIVKYFQV